MPSLGGGTGSGLNPDRSTGESGDARLRRHFSAMQFTLTPRAIYDLWVDGHIDVLTVHMLMAKWRALYPGWVPEKEVRHSALYEVD